MVGGMDGGVEAGESQDGEHLCTMGVEYPVKGDEIVF